MSHLIDILGQLATLAPKLLRVESLCLSVRSFWKIGKIVRSKSSPSDRALYICDSFFLDRPTIPPAVIVIPPILPTLVILPLGLLLSNLLLCIVATFGVLWTYSNRVCCFRRDSMCLHSCTRREDRWGHSPTGCFDFMHFSRDLSETDRWITADTVSSHFSINIKPILIDKKNGK